MTNNETKGKYHALLAEEIIADPDILRGKKLTGFFLIIWLATRSFFFIMEIICSRTGFIDFNAVNIVSFVMSLLFALVLNTGVKYFPALPLVGGLMMVISGFRNGYYPLLCLELYPELWLYIVSYILAGWTQILIMLALLFLPPCAKFAAAGSRISKKLNGRNEPAGPHL